jgi:hypothetical protein
MKLSQSQISRGKPDFSNDPVNKVQCWYGSAHCAVVSDGGWVRLFSIAERKFVRDFFTHQDPGVLNVAVSDDDQYCFVGSYYAWALACFEIRTGKIVWKREDLRRFYGLTYSPELRCLFGYLNEKSALMIDPKTGQTIESFRGVNYVNASPVNDLVLFGDTRKTFTLRNRSGLKLWTVRQEGFGHGPLNVGWSPGALAISETGPIHPGGPHAGIRCYSSHGELLWRHKRYQAHTWPLMYCPNLRAYVGVEFDPEQKPCLCWLVQWDEQTGRVRHEKLVRHPLDGGICHQGLFYFAVDRKTYDFSLEPISLDSPAEPGTSPNGGPIAPVDNSYGVKGPPSVS